MLRTLLCLAILLVGRPAASAWPDPDTVRDVTALRVTLDSSDASMPSESGGAPARTVLALLYLPRGASSRHRVPAVMLMHGSVGNYEGRG
nr:hypothetical protein [uncultured Lichenicoccus sp.]